MSGSIEIPNDPNETDFGGLDEALNNNEYINIVGPKELTSIVTERLVTKAKEQGKTVIYLDVPTKGLANDDDLFKFVADGIFVNTGIQMVRQPMLSVTTDITHNIAYNLTDEVNYLFVVDSDQNLAKYLLIAERFMISVGSMEKRRHQDKNTNIAFAMIGEVEPIGLHESGSMNKTYSAGTNFLVKPS